MKMSDIKVDPRIKIRVVPDGEIHIIFEWTLADLSEFARAFLAVSNGEIKSNEVHAAFRLRNREGVDYFIRELQKARKELWNGYGKR